MVKVPRRSRIIRFLSDDWVSFEVIAAKLFRGNESFCGQMLTDMVKQGLLEQRSEPINPEVLDSDHFYMLRCRYYYKATASGIEYFQNRCLKMLEKIIGVARSCKP